MLRLAPEGLINIAKHAGQTARVRPSAEFVDGGIRIEVRDYGDD